MAEAHKELYSCTVHDADGSRIGAVSQVYLDDATGEPTFVAVRSGLFGNKEVMVPVAGAFVTDGLMEVPYSADLVKQAPAPTSERHLDPEQEADVYRHYHMAFILPEAESAAAGPTPVAEEPVPKQPLPPA